MDQQRPIDEQLESAISEAIESGRLTVGDASSPEWRSKVQSILDPIFDAWYSDVSKAHCDAALLALNQRAVSKRPPGAGGGFCPTPQQHHIAKIAKQYLRVKVIAIAGAGKTTTTRYIAETLGGHCLYICFNKPVQLHASRTFPRHVECRSAHSLAYRAVGATFRKCKSIEEPSAKAIADFLGWDLRSRYSDAWCVKNILAGFTNTTDSSVGLEHVPKDVRTSVLARAGLRQSGGSVHVNDTLTRLAGHAMDIWRASIDMSQPQIPISHDGYLKLWVERGVTLKYDAILFDECQDASPVMTKAVVSQGAKVVFIGDPHQQIYSFRGAIDAMDHVSGETAYLTGSFRFGPEIAFIANSILKLKGVDMGIEGLANYRSSVEPIANRYPYTLLCRTNAGILRSAVGELSTNSLHIVGGPDALVSLGMSAYNLWIGNRAGVSVPVLKPFMSWDSLEAIAKEVNDPELNMLVNLVSEYGARLPTVLQNMVSRCVADDRAEVVLSTTHKAKGGEWDRVKLGDDFQGLFDETGKLVADDEEINLLYVASTRAKRVLDPNLQLLEAVSYDSHLQK